MKKYFITFILIIYSLCLSAQGGDAIIGEWLTQNSEARITIYAEQGKYVGKIIWIKDSKQSAQLNTVILADFVFDAKEQEWNKGTVFEPRHGHKASGYLVLKDMNSLRVTGYNGFRWISDSETWTRVKPR